MLFFQSNNFKKYSDLELIEHYKKTANNKYIGELFNRYTIFVLGICLKYFKDEDKSKDATMQIFEKLLVDLMEHSIQNFRPWLHQVTRNFCLMELRKEQSLLKKTIELEHSNSTFMESSSSIHLINEDEKEKEKHLTQLTTCILELKMEQKKCIELFFMQEKCYQEIVDLTNFTLKNVKSFIQNGKRNLKLCMERLNG